MPIQSHHTQLSAASQLSDPSDDAWSREIVPRLPAHLDQHARNLKAFQRVRGLACPADLVRAVLAYSLDQLSFRALGAWAVLIGLADISDSAWRKRLERANPLLLWLLGELLCASVQTAPDLLARERRLLLIDATRLGQCGGTGDDWRVHLADDLMLGRISHVTLSDKRTAEKLSHFALQADDIVVGDSGYGYRSQVAFAQDQAADVVVRVYLTTCPLEDAQAKPFDAISWLVSQHGQVAEWSGFVRHKNKRYAVRLLAQRLPTDKVAAAQKHKRRKAQKNQRRIGTQTLQLAGFLVLLTTLDTSWSVSEVLRLYRARWQIELVFKRIKQLLRVAELRCRKRAALEATIRALLVAWALQEQVRTEIEALLPTGEAQGGREASSWLLAGMTVTSLRVAARGNWTLKRIRACLPALVRFVCTRLGKRQQQEREVRKWLYQRLSGATSASTQSVGLPIENLQN